MKCWMFTSIFLLCLGSIGFMYVFDDAKLMTEACGADGLQIGSYLFGYTFIPAVVVTGIGVATAMPVCYYERNSLLFWLMLVAFVSSGILITLGALSKLPGAILVERVNQEVLYQVIGDTFLLSVVGGIKGMTRRRLELFEEVQCNLLVPVFFLLVVVGIYL